MEFQELSKNYLNILNFNGTITSTFFVLASAGFFAVIFIIDLNDSESVKLLLGSSF